MTPEKLKAIVHRWLSGISRYAMVAFACALTACCSTRVTQPEHQEAALADFPTAVESAVRRGWEAFHNKRKDEYAADLTDDASEETLSRMGPATHSLFEVRFYPGGESVMKQDAVVYSRHTASHTFLFFDGDQRPANPIYDPGTMAAAIDADPDQAIPLLDQAIRDATHVRIHFASDGGTQGGNKPQQRDLRKAYLRYFRTNVFFLPMNSLEEAIWDTAISEQFLDTILPANTADQVKAAIAAEGSYKKKFVLLSDAICGISSATSLEILHSMLVKAWATRAPAAYIELVRLIEQLRARL